MDFYTDWNCRLLPTLSNQKQAATECLSSLSSLHEIHGFDRFCLIRVYDGSNHSLPIFLLEQRILKDHLMASSPRQLSVCFATPALLYEGLSEEAELERLLLPHHNCLPLLMPPGAYQEWMDAELNRLLYKRHIRLLFLSFELNAVFYPSEVLARLLRVPEAVYQFNFRAFTDPRLTSYIKTLLSDHATVLLGTGLDQREKIYFYEQSHYLDCIRSALTPMEYQLLLHGNQSFWRS
ncbi:MAG: hypothetical protein IKC31_06260 [Clostridia bacterium]|nr:hypothetical protein [Clostridia bacterium]